MKLSLILLSIFLFFSIPLTFADQIDYYEVLGISKTASDKDIKSAYRKLSKQYHPDKNSGDEEAHHKFIEIGEAYEILIDSEKRQLYDQYGSDALKNGGGPSNANPFGRVRRGQDSAVDLDLTLKQYYNGDSLTVPLDLRDICDLCHGQGGEREHCSTCQGRGVITQIFQQGPFRQQIQTTCPSCHGQGSQLKKKCKKCQGEQVIVKNKSFNIEIPAGVPRDYKYVVRGKAERMPGTEPGDLYFLFHEKPQGNMGYRRRGDNLFRTEYVSLRESLKGNWSRSLAFFDEDDNILTIGRETGVTIFEGEVEIINGKGMPKQDGGYGDLYIDYHVIIPNKPSSLFKDKELSSMFLDEL
ncbi:Scj1p SCDLUD_002216 [Saccharomycodes ludwigii]|uniref:Scj1p n=1 Tax=Saccharomycodes ludwigii TaxID=36035 RepID=UPI001E894538|nr:hypothetical protein SCDLUD_002216 [Saccharomycodes ludwigii]KAH3902395.1 hypothetical protein SCDLUD_002216 [Saccharomycodes ludwigii]